MVLTVGEITAEEAGSKIVAHCKGLDLIKVIVLTKDNVDAVVTGMVQRGGKNLRYSKESGYYNKNRHGFSIRIFLREFHLSRYCHVVFQVSRFSDSFQLNYEDYCSISEISVPTQSKRSILNFPACTDWDIYNIRRCSPSKITSTCRFRRRDGRACVYTIKCPRGVAGYDCSGVHQFTSLVCCNFKCN